MDQGSNKINSPAYNVAPTVTKFCVMWEGLSLPHDTKLGNCRCKIVDSRAFPSWSLIHGLRWSRLIKAEPGQDGRVSQMLGPVSLTFFLPAIQIRWKLRLAITPLLAIRSQQIFAHATTTQLACHVQNFVMITILESRWEWNEISIKF